MSADEFDPEIERLFARTPHMADAPLFTAQVERRLEQGSRVRFLALSLAGVVGGAVALREAVNVNLSLGDASGVVAGEAVTQGVRAASTQAQGLAASALDALGLSGLEVGSLGAMQLFWIAAAALVAVAAAGAMKLAQDV
ncbi:MAG: hypothetical protein KJ676_11865 [Alphaproteobacteria bacterium]|nr:hypothetical protein [Alphaproteobacteria bacterium]MBU1525963.1 hypothetical protein [Alphaproteobacteria bacterium]MBU2117772.1 hypothetical protein [Alphaproteobacteria bacterium]MBU2350371.1 hypothetical protein [Alphaproteobacteria bacterium]MBU2381605.1 hypothetical protein [Alphaproteobacteria bacterium]